MLSSLAIAFFQRSKCLLSSWWRLPSAVILVSPKIEKNANYLENSQTRIERISLMMMSSRMLRKSGLMLRKDGDDDEFTFSEMLRL